MTEYETLGRGYARMRRADPAIAAAIDAGLRDAGSVLNVGAGAGSYEPPARDVTAVEPAAEMIAQRPADSAPAVRAGAEDLPFEDDSFDAAMAVLTVHHWPDRDAGIAEMARVAKDRILIVTFDPEPMHEYWMVSEYFPAIAELHSDRTASVELAATMPRTEVSSIPIPRECTDLFFAALWGRPEMLLDPEVVQPMWVWSKLTEAQREDGLARLSADLASGEWDRRHGDLRERDSLDLGLRMIVSRLG